MPRGPPRDGHLGPAQRDRSCHQDPARSSGSRLIEPGRKGPPERAVDLLTVATTCHHIGDPSGRVDGTQPGIALAKPSARRTPSRPMARLAPPKPLKPSRSASIVAVARWPSKLRSAWMSARSALVRRTIPMTRRQVSASSSTRRCPRPARRPPRGTNEGDQRVVPGSIVAVTVGHTVVAFLFVYEVRDSN